VEHLHPNGRLAVFDEISIRHLIRPSFRHAGKERFEGAWPHLPKLTKGQFLFFFGKGSSLLLRSVCVLQKGNTGCAPTHRGRENGHAAAA
jgi:hypothetical protein